MVAFATMRRLGTAKPRAGTFLLVGVIAGVIGIVQSGCSKDDTSAARVSRRGEVCQVARDCEDGLFCAPVPSGSGGVCVTGNFKIAKTAKSCTLVECAGASDCCTGTDFVLCSQLRETCNADAGFSSEQACVQYAQQCACESGAIDCEAGKCVTRCSDDAQCRINGTSTVPICAGGKCVQCASDTDCGGGRTCVSGACQAACTNDGACSGFDRCVGGHCIPSGCQSDRECVAATRNVDSRCGTDGKCIVPCETDLECGSPTSFQFFACIDKQCTYVGCESDKDCRLFFTGPSDASTLPMGQLAVCQDNGVLGSVVKPAQ
jgi:hypothetical protein